MTKILIKYLDLDDGRYIENDKIRHKTPNSYESEFLSWDELWTGVKDDIEKIQNYVRSHKKIEKPAM